MLFANLTIQSALFAFLGVFLGSIMDGIAGGGGSITIPTYLLCGLPMHMALGTNKFSACIGITASVTRYAKNKYIPWKLAFSGMVFATIGSAIGVKIQLLVQDIYLKYLMLIILPTVAFFVFKQKKLPEEDGNIDSRKQVLIVCVASFVIGTYDGFYGPGTGTFLLLIFCSIAKLNVRTANGTVKLINFGSSIGSLSVSILSHQINYSLGIFGALGAFLGQFIGSKLAVSKGSNIVKPAIIVILIILFAKIIMELF